MRGSDARWGSLFSYVDLEDRVPKRHPLRVIRRIADDVLAGMSGAFDAAYAPLGRPSIPPERLMRALLLQAFYTIRSERQLVERLDFDLLFRWFVGLGIDERVWDASTYAKNRERFLAMDAAAVFLAGVVDHPDVRRQMSRDHFSVDGTLIDAWASMKSFRPKNETGDDDGSGGDKGFDTADFVAELRERRIIPHVARNAYDAGKARRRSNIDGRTTRHPGYAVSQRVRKRIEEIFGGLKTVAVWRKSRFRGLDRTEHGFHLALAACNLTRMPKLIAVEAS